MTGEHLIRLHQNLLYVEAYEFFVKEADRLSDLLERMNWNPETPEERNRLKRQWDRLNETRIVLEQCLELVSADLKTDPHRERSSSASEAG